MLLKGLRAVPTVREPTSSRVSSAQICNFGLGASHTILQSDNISLNQLRLQAPGVAPDSCVPHDLAYISNRWIYHDHDRTPTGSGNAAYSFFHATSYPSRFDRSCGRLGPPGRWRDAKRPRPAGLLRDESERRPGITSAPLIE